MSYLRHNETQKLITRFVNFKESQVVNLKIQVSLDGTEYLSRFGKPITHYELILYVDEQGKKALLKAQDTLELLDFSVKQGDFSGRILECGVFEHLVSGWTKVSVILSADSEVTSL